MAKGTVKWFDSRKGYGFIAGDDGKDIFVHYASISGDGYKTLVEGDMVTFDVAEGEKGLRAENVLQQSPSDKSASENKETPADEKNSTSE